MKFPEKDLPAVGAAAHAIMREAIAAGVWIIGGGFKGYFPQVVGIDGSVTPGPITETAAHIGGFSVINVKSEAEALRWAKKIAVACRCAQEIRIIMDDPEQDDLLV